MDVIVNSTNPELDLSQGFVSKSIRQKAGPGIEDELKTIYKDGIMFGDMVISSGHNLEFHIFHGALFKWISTGNLSLKVNKILGFLRKETEGKKKTVEIFWLSAFVLSLPVFGLINNSFRLPGNFLRFL